jgi:aminotransferase
MCSRCVMDTTAAEIVFDSVGVCNFCHQVEAYKNTIWRPEDRNALNAKIREIKTAGKGKKYDCIIGLSGGVDSSYLAHLVVCEFGLRPLAIHVDAGWNSEIATQNIEVLVRELDIDFYSEILDWKSVQELQRAYLFSGIANLDVPQDHAFFTVLYKMVHKHKVSYFLTGGNMATESILPQSWGYDAMDSANLKDIYSKHGRGKKLDYPTYSQFKRYIWDRYITKVQVPRLLDLYPYNRGDAILLLQSNYGWKNYGNKHDESIWTRWFQSYYLPTKFGFEKRKAHLSSMINSQELTREEALEELQQPLYDEIQLKNDTKFILNKLDVTKTEFEAIMASENSVFDDYKSAIWIRKIIDKIKKLIRD